MSQIQTANEILESDFHYVLIMGEYHDCPTCNDSATLQAHTHWDEKSLLKEMCEKADNYKMTAIWVIDTCNGDMAKYCDIETYASFHRVHKLEFKLPTGQVMIVHGDTGWKVADPAEMILYGTKRS